jgi:hypothetical protein
MLIDESAGYLDEKAGGWFAICDVACPISVEIGHQAIALLAIK